ncbi:monooxygenase [Hypericibacter terrae]|uniref:Monooxygenase n=1 Tax=Hypericibacter terrae TaxID=2602015 RepID=A0A5J6MFK7_9PROT|nr:FAD-dependent oxidoreductase [Hypericibacter terrae]QEX16242.1 monooxygenase [Hypericibacter terrae]
MTDNISSIETGCCIVGGGPAGMMLGLMLARAGVEVTVLEKHADFFRDFRGDTIHPSTLELVYELGLLPEFLTRPHEEVRHLNAVIGNATIRVADFTHLPTHCRFVALMPQWEFLNFLAVKAANYPNFRLLMETEAIDLIEESGRVAGVRARTSQGELALRADLVVGADGRHSRMRDRAGLPVERLGSPIDVLWMRLSRRPSDGDEPLGRINGGRILVMLNRDSYWQCALVIRKDGFEAIKKQGLGAVQEAIARGAPYMRDRVGELTSWDDIKLLTVAVDRLTQWHRPGLLFIGDAAHAMSPIGGVGINLAIQDSAAAANILAAALRQGRPTDAQLEAVQRRRMLPTRIIQWLQVTIQNRVIGPVLAKDSQIEAPWQLRLLGRLPLLQRIPARLVGMGIRPEHVRTTALPPVPRAP